MKDFVHPPALSDCATLTPSSASRLSSKGQTIDGGTVPNCTDSTVLTIFLYAGRLVMSVLSGSRDLQIVVLDSD